MTIRKWSRQKKRTVMPAGILILSIVACFVTGAVTNESSAYMLHSQTHFAAVEMFDWMFGKMIPARGYSKKSGRTMLQWKRQIWRFWKQQLLPAQGYLAEYGKTTDCCKEQVLPGIYLEDGGQEEHSRQSPEEVKQPEPDIAKEQPEPVEKEKTIKKREKNHTYCKRYSDQQLERMSFLKQNIYSIDAITPVTIKDLNMKKLMGKNLKIDKSGEQPKILIYHTHASESFRDSRKGKKEDTIVGAGDVLARELSETYHIPTYHDRTVYDVINGKLDRSQAYNVAAEGVERLLQKYPQIRVIIDLHRDGVADQTRLVTEIDGKKTAQIMFFNGMSRIKGKGEIAYLKNPNRTANLAFSTQMQLAAADEYAAFTRRIFIRSYRYNLHLRGRSTLIEAGAQTNTVQEVKNAMIPLAKILNKVLCQE